MRACCAFSAHNAGAEVDRLTDASCACASA